MDSSKLNLISLIPARAGSKRIPGKNTIEFQGQSLIEWSIKFSTFSKAISKTLISTDDQKIKKFVKTMMLRCNNRSKDLSQDKSATFDVIKEIYFNYLEIKPTL